MRLPCPPVFGMIQRGVEVVIRMMDNVQQKSIQPVIQATIQSGTLIFTDKYDIYNRLPDWGYDHKTVCHSRGEYARSVGDPGSLITAIKLRQNRHFRSGNQEYKPRFVLLISASKMTILP